MSSRDTSGPTNAAPANTTKLEEYLQTRLDANGSFYIKSREIATDLPFSPQQIGRRIPYVNARENGIHLAKYSRTHAITWYVTKTESAGHGSATSD